jgi:light-regulated signal transduction histidine kinase (bacteriophytochrome)
LQGFMTVDLDSCALEPIHTPQAIQPHGAVLSFAPDRRLVGYSANAESFLGWPVALGMGVADLGNAELAAAVDAALRQPASDVPEEIALTLAGAAGDLEATVHVHRARAIVEVERPADMARQGWGPGRAYAHVRNAESVEEVLDRAAQGLRMLTGYDRVMAYRFHPDDSGEVVAEAKIDALASFLGQRYPASDIPAQARRLYMLNAYRAVVDVEGPPVPMLAAPGEPLLDMSFADLRAVSPIHIEYLRNRGVASTMSLSLMVEGRLWGLLACHHGQARQLPVEVRLVCEAFANTVSARVAGLVAAAQHQRLARAAVVREALGRLLVEHERPFTALDALKEQVAETLEADALVVIQGADFAHTVGISRPDAEELVRLATANDTAAFESSSAEGRADAAARRWPGLLARCFDPRSRAWIIAARREQRATVRWAGDPNKTAALGPNGARLTPRGSFEVWQEEVRDRAAPWLPITRDILELLANLLAHNQLAIAAQIDEVRSHMLAVLGHDLRNPLQAIKTVTGLIERGLAPDVLVGQINNSTNRMTRLITQSLDFTRMSHGMALSGPAREVDVVALLREIVAEFTTAYPSVVLRTSAPPALSYPLDPDRFSQVLANLLSNARHHGRPGTTLLVDLSRDEGEGLRLAVRNEANPIPPNVADSLFSPFKRTSLNSSSNPSGLGIGLYIVSHIVQEHGGKVDYRYTAPWVEFTVRLPALSAAAATPA